VKFKDFQLDVEATVAEMLFGHGHAHYGYWPDGSPEQLTVEALGRAQSAYFELLAQTIPEGTQSILDVGSGTGANALELTRRGFAMECLCPSEHLNSLARAKLPEDVAVHTLKFEDFESDKQFDTCMFSESFHYIDLHKALAQLARYAGKNVVIFDYFRTASEETDGTRGTHAEFTQALAAQGVFDVVSDRDMTPAIMPTFEVLDHIKNHHIRPLLLRARQGLGESYPWRMKLANMLFGRRLDKMARPSSRGQSFARKFEYRLIVLTRR